MAMALLIHSYMVKLFYWLLMVQIGGILIHVQGLKYSFACNSVKLSCGPRHFIKVVDAVYGHSHQKCRTRPHPNLHTPDQSCSVSLKQYNPQWFRDDILETCNARQQCQLIRKRRTILCQEKFSDINYINVSYECIPTRELADVCTDFQTQLHTGYLESPGYIPGTQPPNIPDGVPPVYTMDASCRCKLTIPQPYVVRISVEELTLNPTYCDNSDQMFIFRNGEIGSNYTCPIKLLYSTLMTSSLLEEVEIVYKHNIGNPNGGKMLIKYEAMADEADVVATEASVTVKCGVFAREAIYIPETTIEPVVPAVTLQTDSSKMITAKAESNDRNKAVMGMFIGAIMFFILAILVLIAAIVLFCHKRKRNTAESDESKPNAVPLYVEYDNTNRIARLTPPTENAPDIPRTNPPSPFYNKPFDPQLSTKKTSGIYSEPHVHLSTSKPKDHEYSYAYTSILNKQDGDHPHMGKSPGDPESDLEKGANRQRNSYVNVPTDIHRNSYVNRPSDKAPRNSFITLENTNVTSEIEPIVKPYDRLKEDAKGGIEEKDNIDNEASLSSPNTSASTEASSPLITNTSTLEGEINGTTTVKTSSGSMPPSTSNSDSKTGTTGGSTDESTIKNNTGSTTLGTAKSTTKQTTSKGPTGSTPGITTGGTTKGAFGSTTEDTTGQTTEGTTGGTSNFTTEGTTEDTTKITTRGTISSTPDATTKITTGVTATGTTEGSTKYTSGGSTKGTFESTTKQTTEGSTQITTGAKTTTRGTTVETTNGKSETTPKGTTVETTKGKSETTTKGTTVETTEGKSETTTKGTTVETTNGSTKDTTKFTTGGTNGSSTKRSTGGTTKITIGGTDKVTTVGLVRETKKDGLPVWVYITIPVAFVVMVILSVVLILRRSRRIERIDNESNQDGGDIDKTKTDVVHNTYENKITVDAVDRSGHDETVNKHDNVAIINETVVKQCGNSNLTIVGRDDGNHVSVYDKVSEPLNPGNNVNVNDVNAAGEALGSHVPGSVGDEGIEVIALSEIEARKDSTVDECTSLYDLEHASKIDYKDGPQNGTNVDATMKDLLSPNTKTIVSKVNSFGKACQVKNVIPVTSQDKPIEKISDSKSDIDSAINEFNESKIVENKSVEKPRKSHSPNLSVSSQVALESKTTDSTSEKHRKSEIQHHKQDGSKSTPATKDDEKMARKLKGDRKSSLDESSLRSNAERKNSSIYDHRSSVDGLTGDFLHSTISNLKRIEKTNSGKCVDRGIDKAPDENIYENRTVHLIVNAIETGLRNTNTDVKNQGRENNTKSDKDKIQIHDNTIEKKNSDDYHEDKRIKDNDSNPNEIRDESKSPDFEDCSNNQENTTNEKTSPCNETKKGKKSKKGGSQSAFQSLYALISRKLKGKTPLGNINASEKGQPSNEYSYAYGQTNVNRDQIDDHVYTYADLPLQNEAPDDFYSEIPVLSSQIPQQRTPTSFHDTSNDQDACLRNDEYSLEKTTNASANSVYSFERNISNPLNDEYLLETSSQQPENALPKQSRKLETINEALTQDGENENDAIEMLDNDLYSGLSVVIESPQHDKLQDDINGAKVKDPCRSTHVECPDVFHNEIYSGQSFIESANENAAYSPVERNDDAAVKLSEPTPIMMDNDIYSGGATSVESQHGVKQLEGEQNQIKDAVSTTDIVNFGKNPSEVENPSLIDNDLYDSCELNKTSKSFDSDGIDLVNNDIYEKSTAL
ncbi:unnamed protein product [Owenia fusiformis]|uniref:Uncharacterized protein n=1 Tax=Owenia fusiformis TaxID=6347 RepID=A0A8S4Q0X7_OWEFU|nr:unnamed protein product [Owenia fusiformis]